MTDITMPRLSDTMEEGVLAQWHKQVGDEVHKGDTLADIETDKTTMELEAYDEGVLERLLVDEGDTVPVGEPVAVVGDGSGLGSEEPEDRAASDADDRPEQGEGPEDTEGVGAEEDADESDDGEDEQPAAAEGTQLEAEAPVGAKGRRPEGTSADGDDRPLFRSPLARKLARDNDIDLAAVTGTGPGGRIVRADVQQAIDAGATAPSAVEPERGGAERTTGGAAPAGIPEPATAGEGDEEVRINANQRITAERLTQVTGVPTFQLSATIEADSLLAFRRQINDELGEEGVRISVTDLLVRASAVALRAHPEVNSAWGGDKVIRRGHVNIGLAVALEAGLIVPVVRDADRKSVGQIAAESRDLATRARDGKLGPDEYQGGTFSISNLGMYGIDTFNAIINPPEAAILAVGTAVQEPVLRDGELTERTVMALTLTIDHRTLNGAVAAAFLQELRAILESPLRIVI